MEPIILPKNYNYIAAFLTLRCNMNCSYCINKQGEFDYDRPEMTGQEWLKAFGRIETREDLPITLQGGEPTIHRDFYEIVSNAYGKKMDLLTNGKFNLSQFMAYVHSGIFNRKAPYASIRFSHHKLLNDFYLFEKVCVLKNNGYHVGVWGFDTGDHEAMKQFCKENEIDFRVKQFLDKDHGTYKYPEAINGEKKEVECKPSELLIAPDGRLYRCHSDLYAGVNSYAHILDDKVELPDDFIKCDHCGFCNPCDIKLKTNRLQESGHCSVEIRECQ